MKRGEGYVHIKSHKKGNPKTSKLRKERGTALKRRSMYLQGRGRRIAQGGDDTGGGKVL